MPSGRQEGCSKDQDALLESLGCVAGGGGDPSPAAPPHGRIPCSGFWHGHKSEPLAEEGGDAPLPQPVLINVPGSPAAAAPGCSALLFGVRKAKFGPAMWLRGAGGLPAGSARAGARKTPGRAGRKSRAVSCVHKRACRAVSLCATRGLAHPCGCTPGGVRARGGHVRTDARGCACTEGEECVRVGG